MELLETTGTNWKTLTRELGQEFAVRAARSDQEGSFVFENYEQLKTHRYFSALIPESFGGGGMSYMEMCDTIRELAHYCGSTALAFSMHQHLVAATVWKYIHKGEGAPVLKNVAEKQLVLISTGAGDWLASNGVMEKVENGYLLSGKKHFASQSVGGDVVVSSAPYQDPSGEWQVLHFSAPMQADGVSILDDWDVMGMRATGSQTILFEKVFIPESAIALTRPRGDFHPVWNVVLTVAMPLIMAAYVGIAERAVEIAVSAGKRYQRGQDHMPLLVGRLHNLLLSAQTQWRAMYELTNNFDFQPSEKITVDILSYKTNVAEACKETVAAAMEAIGGQAVYRGRELERLFRDVQAASYHPLPRWEQYAFTGERLLGR